MGLVPLAIPRAGKSSHVGAGVQARLHVLERSHGIGVYWYVQSKGEHLGELAAGEGGIGAELTPGSGGVTADYPPLLESLNGGAVGMGPGNVEKRLNRRSHLRGKDKLEEVCSKGKATSHCRWQRPHAPRRRRSRCCGQKGWRAGWSSGESGHRRRGSSWRYPPSAR